LCGASHRRRTDFRRTAAAQHYIEASPLREKDRFVPIFYFLLVIVSLSCGTLPPSDDIDAASAALATGGMVLAWAILCHVAARMIALHVRDQMLDPIVGARWLEIQLAAFRWIGLAVAVLCLGGFGVARVLDRLPVVGQSMSLQAVLLLIPAVAITVATWSAEHHYGVILKYASPASAITSDGCGNRSAAAWRG
jgi:hypothetical protein